MRRSDMDRRLTRVSGVGCAGRSAPWSFGGWAKATGDKRCGDMSKADFVGRWRITWMEEWDTDYIYIHMGDDSAFRARRWPKPGARKARTSKRAT